MAKTIAEDLLLGAQAIAEFTGLSRTQVYNMLRKKNPAIKNEPGLGVTARKSVLRQHFGIPEQAAE
ncbi:MAG: hypothetical protein H7Y60_09120 [Rhodospirillaceae bacterium]|nr:hypothetical protein [Rhodospirillales bacterium]